MMKLKGTRIQSFRDNNLNFAADVRPHQSVGVRKGRWVLGDTTEVLDHNSWRLGKIAKVLKNDYFIIRVTGRIQMREFHISCLRFPHGYHSKQSAVVDRGRVHIKTRRGERAQGIGVSDARKITSTGGLPGQDVKVREQSERQTQRVDHTFHQSKLVMEQDHHSNEANDHTTKRHKAVKLCPSSSARNVKKKLEPTRMPPDDSITGSSKKRKRTASAYDVCRPTKKQQTNTIYSDSPYRPFTIVRYNELAKNNFTKRKSDSKVLPSSQMLLPVREDNECSVASCSVNFSEHSINDNSQSIGLGNCFSGDAMSTCPSMPRQESDNVYGCDLEMNVHELELQAYQSTVRAFYASGALTWEQEALLTNLRLSLNITNEEHLLQLRHLLSS
ncbi:hypothetical protein GUJ93_ZPchr0013g36040 [Zizania palustris]|uniref:ENT domain-containing protein n=1 Tax=Zizania palustris TaxID=103762 RepID=A0A8J5WYP4_ZIZPA|nr:hypothetical protein GUJ93_ZPchr0013g36040 [Zizania palustris]